MKADDLSSVTQSHFDFGSSVMGNDNEELGDGTAVVPPLQGRDSEKLKLLEVYQHVLQTQQSQTVLVHGMSGQGKTTLVDTLREPVCDTNAYFCAGKFFQDPGIQEPYSAITAAFSDLCDLVAQSSDFDEQSRVRIRECLTIDGHLLSRSVNLTPFFSGDESTALLYSSSSVEEKTVNFARFRAACKAFLVAMASKKHPIVLFIDDIQWMDTGSSKLLDMFINHDDDIKNVMFVLSYRDEEASTVEKMILRPSSEDNGRVTDIQLSNLDFPSVRQILAWQLGPMTHNLDELSELTLKRTGGNPFFINLFLDALEASNFLVMNGPSPKFDVEAIRSSFMVADSIADCLSQKLCRLPSKVRDVLTIASLIGYSFDEEVLLEMPGIVEITTKKEKREEIVSLLALATDEGFIERVRGGHQFTHDKLQSAFQGLVDKATRERLHLRIGKMFLAHNAKDSFYNAAVHLNAAPGFLYSTEQCILLARINLNASKHCQQISAFDKAVSLLLKGVELLDSINLKWSDDAGELSLELTESLARMALLVGNFDACFEATREALLHVDTKAQKVNLLLINVECRMADNDMKGTIKASTEALSELGVKLPSKVNMLHIIFKFIQLKVLMVGKTEEDILSLPYVSDTSWSDAIRLLMHITFYATSSLGEESTGRYTALIAMELTLKYGLSPYAAPALATFAFATLQMGNTEQAYTLGRLSLKLMEQSPSREGDCPTIGFVNTLLLHRKEPIRNLRGPFLAAATAGFARGDVVYSTLCISQYFGTGIASGVHLEELEESLHCQYNHFHDLGQDELLIWVRPFMQCVANLRSSSTDWRQLALMSGGDFMNFNKHLLEANAAKNSMVVVSTTLVMKIRLANAFGFHCITRETLQELEPFQEVLRTVFVYNTVSWEACIAYYEGFIADGKRKHLRKARKYKKYLERANVSGPNASAYLRHLKLKESLLRRPRRTYTDPSLINDTLRLLDHEVEEISQLDSSCTPCFVVARAYVDAGTVAERMGCFGEAQKYFERAREVYYQNWGATALAVLAEQKCEAIRRQTQPQEAAFNCRNALVGGIVQFGE